MDAAADRPEFAPPQQPGLLSAFVLAVIAHLLLLVALTFGLHWQRESENAVAEAELWSQLPQEAAPKPEPTPPPPPPAPPVVRAPPLPDVQAQRDAQIALEREKQKREAEEERRQEELQKQRELDRKRKLEAQRKHDEEVARQKEEQRQLADAKRRDDLEKEKKRKQQEEAQEKKQAQQRDENIRRSLSLAGPGSSSSAGNADKSSGPSAGYAGRIASLIKSNTNFGTTVPGDPPVEVEIQLAPDGTIVRKRITRSSGNRVRDDEVLRGIERIDRIPRDKDGSIYTPMVITVRQF